ncbi:hypothetical protein [Aminivibrio sp.]|uniref:hypothetical protein n=1 Tax=Aminivibrio sp. TaxID=1872489 RepID=UPI003D9862A4
MIKTMLSSVRRKVIAPTREGHFRSRSVRPRKPFVTPRGLSSPPMERRLSLDRFGKRIRLFDAAGDPRWMNGGTKGRGEDGTFAWPTVIAFAPDGSLYVADEGYSVDANIQHFSRKGKFLGKIKADRKTLGEKGIYKPDFLAVTETGKIIHQEAPAKSARTESRESWSSRRMGKLQAPGISKQPGPHGAASRRKNSFW